METAMRLVLWIHILAGTLALFVAPVALLTAKGGRAHRRAGKLYFWAMAVVAATALGLGLWRPVIFLVLVAVFSFYAALSGYRVLSRKRPDQGQRATPLDWIAAALTLLASGGLIGLGILKPTETWRSLSVVAIVFGGIGLALALRDIIAFVRPPADRRAWWYQHMGNMIGSYIAAVTAFSVVNFGFLPTTVRWLWPTIIGVPAIALWITYYKIRFQRPRLERRLDGPSEPPTQRGLPVETAFERNPERGQPI